MMKVRIDREACTMYAICWTICSDFFEESPEDGYSQVVGQYRIEDQVDHGKAPDTLSDCVTKATDGCPVEIIHIEET
jgi:ferredoxin